MVWTVQQTTQHKAYVKRASCVTCLGCEKALAGTCQDGKWRCHSQAAIFLLKCSGWGWAGQHLLLSHRTLTRCGRPSSRWAGDTGKWTERARVLKATLRTFPLLACRGLASQESGLPKQRYKQAAGNLTEGPASAWGGHRRGEMPLRKRWSSSSPQRLYLKT